jgi:DNA-binding transcriptional ArsR family regulator
MSVGDIAARMPVSRPAVSQHLKALADAGLVSAQARGTARFYRIERDGLSDLRAWVAQFWDEPLARFKAHAENKTERKANVRRKD